MEFSVSNGAQAPGSDTLIRLVAPKPRKQTQIQSPSPPLHGAMDQAAVPTRLSTEELLLRCFGDLASSIEQNTSRSRPRLVGQWGALLSMNELCEYLAVSPTTLAKICPVHPIDLGVNLVRWRRADIDAWLSTLLPRFTNKRETGPGPAVTPSLQAHSCANERKSDAIARIKERLRCRQ